MPNLISLAKTVRKIPIKYNFFWFPTFSTERSESLKTSRSLVLKINILFWNQRNLWSELPTSCYLKYSQRLIGCSKNSFLVRTGSYALKRVSLNTFVATRVYWFWLSLVQRFVIFIFDLPPLFGCLFWKNFKRKCQKLHPQKVCF